MRAFLTPCLPVRKDRRRKLYAYGEAQARKLGIGEEDVERIIHEHREQTMYPADH
jgi:hypothetical protein